MRKPRNESNFKRNFRTALLTNPLIIYKTTSGKILTRDAIRVLVCCASQIDDMFYHGHEYKTHFLDTYLSKYMNHVEIFSALKYLESLGMIENLRGDKDDYRFSPTHECINFFELRRKNCVYLIINSVLLPLFIAIITTLVTLAINGVL